MKTLNLLSSLILILAFMLVNFTYCRAQDIWAQKADFGDGVCGDAFGFSIGDKGYIGGGSNGIEALKSFWEYDPSSGAWTQKADYAEEVRYATGFSIGSYGYVGTGLELGGAANDFWQYNPANNNWSKKASFPGSDRYWAMGFSIGDKGYIGTGYNDGNLKKDFYEYDPATNKWTQKANAGDGTRRDQAVGFSIGEKGYMVTGFINGSTTNDLWEYDPGTDQWTKKTDFPGLSRTGAVGFSLNGKGYLGTGQGVDSVLRDFWEYDSDTDTWTEKTTFGGVARSFAVGFAIGNKGYIGTGALNYYTFLKDFWQYSPATACTTPIGLNTTNITSTKATLTWNAVDSAVKYQARYKAVGNANWTLANSMGTSKTIAGLSSNTPYTWQVRSACSTNPLVVSDWSDKHHFTTLLRLGLDEASNDLDVYPNPFSSSAVISFSLAEDSYTVIELNDLSGKKVSTVLDQNLNSGEHSVELNCNQLTDGIYLLQLKSDNQISTIKIMLQ